MLTYNCIHLCLPSPSLKMLALHINNLIIGQKFYSTLCLLNKLTIQQCISWLMSFEQKSNNATTTKQKCKHYKSLPELGIEPGTSRTAVWYLWPLDPQDNWTCRLKSNNLTVSMQWVETLINKAKFRGQTVSTKSFFCYI